MSERGLPAPGPEPRRARPRMPPSYGVERASRDAMLPWSYVTDQMARARNYWIGSADRHGRPHAAPVWGVWLDEVFYFSTDPRSRKGRDLAANPEIVVHLESGDDVVILEGTAERVADESTLSRLVEAYEAKYGFRPDPSNPGSAVYRLLPRVAYAWLEQDFTRTATRWSCGN